MIVPCSIQDVFNYQCSRHNIIQHLASVNRLIKQKIETLFTEYFKQAITLLHILYLIIQSSLSPGTFINNEFLGVFS